MKPQAIPDPSAFDEVRLREMLDLVGPASERRLLASLIGDLQGARGALAEAILRRDARALCSQTHVLAALAGTFGAPALAAAAQAMESGAKADIGADDGARVLALTDQLMTSLSARIPDTPAKGAP